MAKEQEEIELLELNSPTSSTKTYVKKDNKIRSPPYTPKTYEKNENNKDVTKLFVAKGQKSPNSFKTYSVPSTSKGLEIAISPRKSDSISETSRFSDDVFLTDRKTSVDSQSKDSKSYKDRIKDRFQMLKENAGKSTHRASFKNTTNKLIMEKIRRENVDIEASIQLMRGSCEKRIIHVDREKMYNFFVGENGPPQIGDKDDNRSLAESTERCTNDSRVELFEDDSLVEFRYPEYLKIQEKESAEELLFHPSGKLVEVTIESTPDESTIAEDEGYSSTSRTNISNRHSNILKKRLLNDGNKGWFDSKGELKFLENPSTSSSLRLSERTELNGNLTIFRKPILGSTECQDILVIKENILHINLHSIKFDHHPLFSLEHVLQRQLQKTCDQYEEYLTNATLKRISDKLETARQNLMDLKNSAQDKRKEKLYKYRREVKDLRESLFEQGKEERRLLKLALSLWKTIKELRIKNGYSNTSIKLIINKESVDIEKEEDEYEENLHKNFNEIIAEHREEFRKKMRAYKEEMKNFEHEEFDTPIKPIYKVDEDLIFSQLETRFKECFKSPIEPIVRLNTTDDNEITNDSQDPQEISRRNAVLSTKIYLKIICDNMTICKTNLIPLNDSFMCDFNENFSVLLNNIPEFLTVVVIEKNNTLRKRILVEINLNLPSEFVTISNAKFFEKDFQKIAKVQYKHEGVGSGVYLHRELENRGLNFQNKMHDIELNTGGIVHYTAFWEKGKEANNEDVRPKKILREFVNKYGAIQVDKLADWFSQNKPDPDDPKNALMYRYIREMDENRPSKKTRHFRLNPYQKPFEFCSISEIDNNIRMKILQLRNQNVPEFDGMLVPNRIKEIPLTIFKDYQRRLAHEKEGFLPDDDEEDEDYDSKRKLGIKKLKLIYIKVFQECKSADNNLDFADVVDEKYLIHFQRFVKVLSANILNFFRWRPRINQPLPEVKTSNIEKNNQEVSSLVKIRMKVLNGINIPSRDTSIQKTQDKSSTVKPYVEIRFNDIFDRTTTVEGTQPVWNEELCLVLNPSHFDYLNPNSLSGNILVSVFDEIDQNVQFKEIKSRNWLGSFEVPLSAICSNNDMEGYFKIGLPNVMFGYIKEENLNQNITSLQTYLNLQFSVQPNIPKLTPSIEELPCSDLPYLRDYVMKWNKNFNNSFPSRKFSALAINSSGKTVCIVRYIKALEPPQLNNEGFDVNSDQCAKYVSSIPFTNCNNFYQNVWLSTDQFLQLLTGSVIDHAIALTCFLLSLKLDVWLMLGFGIPYGSTAYVLLRESSKETELPLYFLYDVVNGEKISILDAYCPLQRIYCLIGEENVWANIQRTDNLALTRFDFGRRSDWLPLFNNEVSAPTNSIHRQVVYAMRKNADELEMQLEKKIKKLISKSRPLHRTLWNNRISNIIKNNIHLLDYVYMHGRGNHEICNEIKKNVSEYDVCGYVLNIPYTNFSTIIKKIKVFGVYFQDSTNAEYSLAVQLMGQPGHVASVWIFLASIKEK